MDPDRIFFQIINILDLNISWRNKLIKSMKILNNPTLVEIRKDCLVDVLSLKLKEPLSLLINDWNFIMENKKIMEITEEFGDIICIPLINKSKVRLLYINSDFVKGDLIGFEKIMRIIGHMFDQYKSTKMNKKNIKDSLMTNISHELRTPLNSIVGHTSILEYTKLDDVQIESVNNIRQASYNLLRLINDMIDINKLENSKMKMRYSPTNLKEIITSSYEVANEAQLKDVTYRQNIDIKAPRVIMVDEIRIKQVLINLINNAFKFTEIGYVKVNVSVESIREITSSSTEEFKKTNCKYSTRTLEENIGNEYILRFEISDTGIGIKEKDIGKLFSSFTQLDTTIQKKYKGTGLGLAISKEIIQLMEGVISVESELGRGSTFAFEIPVREYKTEIIDIDYDMLIGVSVLIVDDKEENIEYLTKILDKYNINYRECTSGARAIRSYVNNSRFDFDLGLIDICMPEMDGNKLSEYIGMSNTPFPLVALSSTNVEDISNNFDIVLRKPYNELEVIHGIYQIISSNSPRRKLKRDNIQKISKKIKRGITITPQKMVNNYDINILIAEDNEMNQNMLITMLRQMGYTRIDLACDGKEVIKAIRRNKGITLQKKGKKYIESEYDVILMDIIMPGMDGYTASKKIIKMFEMGKYPKIIAITANALPGDREKYLKIMDGYISKPIKREELKDTLSKISSKSKKSTISKSSR